MLVGVGLVWGRAAGVGVLVEGHVISSASFSLQIFAVRGRIVRRAQDQDASAFQGKYR